MQTWQNFYWLSVSFYLFVIIKHLYCGVKNESGCLVLLAGVAGNLLSTWFSKNEKLASNFFDSFLFLLRALDFLSKKGTFHLWAIQFLFKTTSFKSTLLSSYYWDFLIDTWINLNETIWSARFFVVFCFLSLLVSCYFLNEVLRL